MVLLRLNLSSQSLDCNSIPDDNCSQCYNRKITAGMFCIVDTDCHMQTTSPAKVNCDLCNNAVAIHLAVRFLLVLANIGRIGTVPNGRVTGRLRFSLTAINMCKAEAWSNLFPHLSICYFINIQRIFRDRAPQRGKLNVRTTHLNTKLVSLNSEILRNIL